MSLTAVRKGLPLSRILSNNKAVLANTSKTFLYSQVNSRTIARSLSFLCKNRESSYLRQVPLAKTCTCAVHTDREDDPDVELAEYLGGLIALAKKAHIIFDDKRLDGFHVNYSEADVTLTKKENDELIVIKSNVKYSLDDAELGVMDPNNENKIKTRNENQMTVRPHFSVEITKHENTLCFHCGYPQYQRDGENPGAEPIRDSFEIYQISIDVGEFKDLTDSISGEILDGNLYDPFMIYLENRGISNEFADKMTLFFTSYKHQLYINLLQGMKSFVEEE